MEHLTKQTFKEKIFNYELSEDWKFNGDKPCIIDFFSDWCQPCKILAPILEELATEYEGKVDFYKVNVSEEMELSSVFGIRSIPTILFCPMDEKPQMSTGLLPKNTIDRAINEILLK